MAKTLKVNEGDWICGEKSCGNINFSWRDKCNKCGKSKGKVDVFKKAGNEIGRQLATKSGGLFSAEDWQCPMCGNVNWARRNECNVCKQPKFSKVEARTGAGGGYCDRDNVEYIDRYDSDDEIDDFGRKKKQYRLSSKSRNDSKIKDKKTKEEKNGTLSKYNITRSNQEENIDDEEEEDEDVDLSKYDLIVSDEEESQMKSDSPHKRSRSRSRSSSPKRRRHSYRSRSRSPDRRKRSRSRSYERGRGHKRAHSRSRSRSRSHERKGRSKEHRRSHRSRSQSRDRR